MIAALKEAERSQLAQIIYSLLAFAALCGGRGIADAAPASSMGMEIIAFNRQHYGLLTGSADAAYTCLVLSK